ncbi:MAG: DeoR/GlpR family DNA-binding transcription regulator [Sphaerochaetaceae bacterium]|nr:DeoR/GlpR family DNA-binding transcription regulator [Sphaerochaetaceae bacterium]
MVVYPAICDEEGLAMKEELLEEIRKFIISRPEVTLIELCDTFHVSMSTTRRYVATMARDPYFQKFYGGIRFTGEQVSVQEQKIATADRIVLAKRAIARKAAEYIKDHDIIFIDSGTTTRHILDFVHQDIRCTVITNNYHVINSAMKLPNCRLIVLPGIFNRQTSAFIGEYSSAYLEAFNIHKAFLACTGLNIPNGATNTYPEENATKSLAAKKAKDIFLLADHRKFGRSTLMTFCPLAAIKQVITDELPSDEIVEAFATHGNAIIVACG